MDNWLTKNLNIKFPIIIAPMFLVSNEDMLIAAHKAGVTGCIPALNYRTPEEFETGLKNLHKNCESNFGVNLIVNKSNIHLQKQLDLLEKYPVSYVITSLGGPKETIDRLSPKGTKVFCDVVNIEYAKKVEALGADAIIAVNSGAGGHAGKIPPSLLIPMLKANCKLPIISAGGIGTGDGMLSMKVLGACGYSIGSPFIATEESPVSKEYKQAIVDYGADDIVMTDKLSGTPCTVINTPYLKKIGTKQNSVEKFLNTNKKLKKYAKMVTYYKGTKLLEKAAFGGTYKTLWCAGPSIEFVKKISPVSELVAQLINEYNQCKNELIKDLSNE